MSANNAEQVLREFGEKIGIPSLAFNTNKLCTMAFDDLITHIRISDNGKLLTFYLWIAEIESDQRSDVAVAIADANYLLGGTQGATLGMNSNSGDLVLATRIPDAMLTLVNFEQTLENLVNLAQTWQKRLAKGLNPEEIENLPSIPTSDNNFSFRA